MKDAMYLESEAVDQLEELVQRVETLELQLQQIFERKHTVELDTPFAVETGRLLLTATLTFIGSSFLFFLVGIEAFLLSALLPTFAYLGTSLALSYLRRGSAKSQLRKQRTHGIKASTSKQ